MATIDDLRTRVRSELGDRLLPFRDTLRGTGDVSQYELSANNITTTGFSVERISGANTTVLASPADYTLDAVNGVLDLTVTLAQDDLLLVSGSSYGLFSDDELDAYVNDALAQHNRGRSTTPRYQDENGFIRYDQETVTVDNLPPEEDLLVVLLATIEALWTLSTDAATDINVQTSDGTTVDRGQRFSQIQTQIGLLTDRYQMLCEKLGVGLFSIEVTNLRRVSRTTNRLVPIFREQEYDDYSLPKRVIPPSQPGHQYDDESGIPSQTLYGYF